MMGGDFWFQRNLAPLGVAKKTREALEMECVRISPRTSAGADLKPLDVFVNHALRGEVRGRDFRPAPKLKKKVAVAIGILSPRPEFLE